MSHQSFPKVPCDCYLFRRQLFLGWHNNSSSQVALQNFHSAHTLLQIISSLKKAVNECTRDMIIISLVRCEIMDPKPLSQDLFHFCVQQHTHPLYRKHQREIFVVGGLMWVFLIILTPYMIPLYYITKLILYFYIQACSFYS